MRVKRFTELSGFLFCTAAISYQGGRAAAEPFHVPKGLDIDAAFLEKNSSGWSLSYEGDLGATDEVLRELRGFYAHPNEELYRLMAALGPGIGWRGRFKAGG